MRALRKLRNDQDVAELIRETAARPRMSQFARMATALPLVYTSFYWFSEEQKIVSGHFHEQIAVALSQRDGERAEFLMREHLHAARDFLVVEIRRRAQPGDAST